MTVVCKGGVEVSGELIGPSEQGLASEAESSAGSWPCRAGTTNASANPSVLTHLRKEHGREAPAKGSDAIHDAVQQHLTAHLHGQFRGNGHYHVHIARA
jgi:hypothetical protein